MTKPFCLKNVFAYVYAILIEMRLESVSPIFEQNCHHVLEHVDRQDDSEKEAVEIRCY